MKSCGVDILGMTNHQEEELKIFDADESLKELKTALMSSKNLNKASDLALEFLKQTGVNLVELERLQKNMKMGEREYPDDDTLLVGVLEVIAYPIKGGEELTYSFSLRERQNPQAKIYQNEDKNFCIEIPFGEILLELP